MDWMNNAIIYQIFIDRFSCGKARDSQTPICEGPVFCGGNIRGIIERLDYLHDLGITALWITPLNTTSAYHGYHITDYFSVDPHFGTLEDVKELISLAHGKGIKLLIDFVPNHLSSQHPYFIDAQQNKDSQYRNWFYFQEWPDEYRCFLQYRELPKLNLDHPPAREHIIAAAKYWLGVGFDGLRLDHVFGPSHDFWRAFRREVKKDFPHAVLVGEAYGISGVHKIAWKNLPTINLRGKFWKRLFQMSDQGMCAYVGELDGTLDFTFQKMMLDYIARGGFFRPRWLLALKLKFHYMKFPKGFFLPTFLDNHDLDRFIFIAGGNKEKLKIAAQIQFAQNQPAIIYQGTEMGVLQKCRIDSVKSYGDLEVRTMLPWGAIDQELFAFYQGLIRKKKTGNDR